jgi:hypothetical protein
MRGFPPHALERGQTQDSASKNNRATTLALGASEDAFAVRDYSAGTRFSAFLTVPRSVMILSCKSVIA